MEIDKVQYRREKWKNNLEGLNRAIQVLVIDSVFIVIAPFKWGHLVSNECNAIVTWIRFDLGNSRACPLPSHNGRLHPHRVTERRKCEVGCAAYEILAIGSVVILVALPRIRLAPDILVRSNVCGFGKIGRALIKLRVQIINFNNDPV